MVAKRKGFTARWGLEAAWGKDTGRCTRTDPRLTASDESATDDEVGIIRDAGGKSGACVAKAAELIVKDLWHVADSRLEVE